MPRQVSLQRPIAIPHWPPEISCRLDNPATTINMRRMIRPELKRGNDELRAARADQRGLLWAVGLFSVFVNLSHARNIF